MLETHQLNPKKATHDIECFKVVRPMIARDARSEHVLSNVVGYEYVVGQENIPIDVRVERTVYTDVDDTYFLVVKAGYHSYQSDKDINPSEGCEIRRCTIPAGSTYFEDVYHKQFVSSQIIIGEKI